MATKTDTKQSTTAQTTEAAQTATKTDVLEIPTQIDKLETKSAKIRALNAEGWTRGQIAKALNIRYQHVRNVLVTPLKSQEK